MSSLIHPVILSGGSGTRLWPLSRRSYPKQLLALAGLETLIQETARRVGDSTRFAPPLILCNEEHRFIIAEQLRTCEIVPDAIVLEPIARNTAPALTIAALMISARDPDGVILALPSDHVIEDLDAFLKAVDTSAEAANRGLLTTFGIVPDGAETGFGYLRRGSPIEEVPGAFHLSEFVEKPDRDSAERYVASGDYSWNSGMFALPVGPFLAEVERLQPELLQSMRLALALSKSDLDFTRLDEEAFSAAPNLSIDRAVMERTNLAAVVPVEIGWNDIGSWAALWEVGQRDSNENVTSGDVLLHDVENCFIRSEKRLVASVGVRNLIIVETDDAVLVTQLDRAQDVKEIVSVLDHRARTEAEIHTKVYRPWGSYQGVAEGDRFQVKQIIVAPGQKLSLQMHHHRAEHWIVVEGTALVTKGEETMLLSENQSTYIPIGESHRLENPGDANLILIEVQSGSYLGEDDIVRFDDIYGRKS